jgi:hypothetical protein
MVSFGESSISFEVIFKGFPAEQIFEIMISLCNLMRVKCVNEVSSNIGLRDDKRYDKTYTLTYLGLNFISAYISYKFVV